MTNGSIDTERIPQNFCASKPLTLPKFESAFFIESGWSPFLILTVMHQKYQSKSELTTTAILSFL